LAFNAYRDEDERAEILATLGKYKLFDAKIKMIGVWDTVGSLGIPSLVGAVDPILYGFLDTGLHPDVLNAYQALAIDERRSEFPATLWTSSPIPGQTIEQVWFAGVHCDVGGGYRETESGLAKIALAWMLEEAEAQQLLVDPVRKEEVLGRTKGSPYAAPNAKNGLMHESLTGAWNVAELVPKRHFDWTTGKWGHRMNWWRRRTIPPNSLVHESAYERSGGYSSRLPADAIRVATLVAQPEVRS